MYGGFLGAPGIEEKEPLRDLGGVPSREVPGIGLGVGLPHTLDMTSSARMSNSWPKACSHAGTPASVGATVALSSQVFLALAGSSSTEVSESESA